jgi:hypothetical protein
MSTMIIPDPLLPCALRPRIQLNRKLPKNAKATPADVATNLITSGVM